MSSLSRFARRITLNSSRFIRQCSSGFNFDFDFDKDFGSSHRVDTSRQRQPQSFGSFGSPGAFGRKQFSRAQIEWSKEDLTPFTKDFYTEHPEITKRSDAEVEQFRKEASMIIHGSNIPKPFERFENSGLPGV